MQEWKYNRARVYMEFEDEAHAVPPPFNVLWNCARAPRAFYKFMRRVRVRRQVVNTQLRTPMCTAQAPTRDKADVYGELLLRLFDRYREHNQQTWKTIGQLDVEVRAHCRQLLQVASIQKIDKSPPSIISDESCKVEAYNR
jgi:hypothetical protein